MADMDYFGADYGAEAPSRLVEAARSFGLVNWVGAATSTALTIGLCVWAGGLAFGDVSRVPVIRAVEGPMRVAPEDPGGTHMPYQGLALSDITSGGAASPAPDEIVLAPPPVQLDAPALAEREAAAVARAAGPEAVETAAAATPAAAPALDDEAAALVEKLAALSAEGAPELANLVLVRADASAPIETEAATEAAAPGPRTIAVADAVATAPLEPGLTRSARPRLRPAALRRAVATPAASPVAAPAAPEGTRVAALPTATDAAPVEAPAAAPAPGTRVAQVGAFDSEAIARAEWTRLQGAFGDYLQGRGQLIQQAQSGGRDFWRLRITGFEGPDDLRRFCSALVAREQACIPVTVR